MPEDLTPAFLKNLPIPKDKRIEIKDTRVPGLAFRLTPKGLATWSLAFELDGRKSRHALGYYPDMGIREARAKASELKVQLRGGHDPRAERKADASSTLGPLLEQFIELRMSLPSRRPDAARLRRGWASLSDTPVKVLKPHQLQRPILQEFSDGKIPSGNAFIRDAKSFLRWLVAQDYIEHKFLMAFEDTIKKRKVEVDHRIYSAPEVRALYNAADQFSPQWRDFLRFQLLTAQRHADVARMEWQHVDLAQHSWTQPADRTKNGRTHIVHLSAPALEILKAMQPQVGKARELVFATTTGGAMHHNNERNKAYFRNAHVEHGGRHAFRHTMVTLLAQCGHSEDVVDMALGHARKGVKAVYQKFQYLPQRADALDDWGQIVIGKLDPDTEKQTYRSCQTG